MDQFQVAGARCCTQTTYACMGVLVCADRMLMHTPRHTHHNVLVFLRPTLSSRFTRPSPSLPSVNDDLTRSVWAGFAASIECISASFVRNRTALDGAHGARVCDYRAHPGRKKKFVGHLRMPSYSILLCICPCRSTIVPPQKATRARPYVPRD